MGPAFMAAACRLEQPAAASASPPNFNWPPQQQQQEQQQLEAFLPWSDASWDASWDELDDELALGAEGNGGFAANFTARGNDAALLLANLDDDYDGGPAWALDFLTAGQQDTLVGVAAGVNTEAAATTAPARPALRHKRSRAPPPAAAKVSTEGGAADRKRCRRPLPLVADSVTAAVEPASALPQVACILAVAPSFPYSSPSSPPSSASVSPATGCVPPSSRRRRRRRQKPQPLDPVDLAVSMVARFPRDPAWSDAVAARQREDAARPVLRAAAALRTDKVWAPQTYAWALAAVYLCVVCYGLDRPRMLAEFVVVPAAVDPAAPAAKPGKARNSKAKNSRCSNSDDNSAAMAAGGGTKRGTLFRRMPTCVTKVRKFCGFAACDERQKVVVALRNANGFAKRRGAGWVGVTGSGTYDRAREMGVFLGAHAAAPASTSAAPPASPS